MDKQALRREIRQRKRAMTEEDIRRRSVALAQALAETRLYREAKTIYGYLSYNQEVRTAPILEQALREGKAVAVPKIFGEEMRFILITDLSQTASGYGGIPEPIADGPTADDPAALVLMPGLAFDAKGRRMGYGGGFYDRFLAREPQHPTVALCYDFQLLPQVPTDPHDVLVDLVLWA